MASLQAMRPDEASAFAARQLSDYITHRTAAGEDAEHARQHAESQYAQFFPGGAPAPGHRLYFVLDGESQVGTLWIGPAPDSTDGKEWVYYVEVDEPLRGRGYGTAAMLLAEEDSASHGAAELGLNVFGFNKRARGLYESLGYETMSLQMRKLLAGG